MRLSLACVALLACAAIVSATNLPHKKADTPYIKCKVPGKDGKGKEIKLAKDEIDVTFRAGRHTGAKGGFEIQFVSKELFDLDEWHYPCKASWDQALDRKESQTNGLGLDLWKKNHASTFAKCKMPLYCGSTYIVRAYASPFHDDGVIYDRSGSSDVIHCWTGECDPKQCVQPADFWGSKQEVDDWPNNKVALGELAYPQSLLLDILSAKPKEKNALVELGKELAGAKLNIFEGAEIAHIKEAIAKADSIIRFNEVPPRGDEDKLSYKDEHVQELIDILKAFNNGHLEGGPKACPDPVPKCYPATSKLLERLGKCTEGTAAKVCVQAHGRNPGIKEKFSDTKVKFDWCPSYYLYYCTDADCNTKVAFRKGVGKKERTPCFDEDVSYVKLDADLTIDVKGDDGKDEYKVTLLPEDKCSLSLVKK